MKEVPIVNASSGRRSRRDRLARSISRGHRGRHSRRAHRAGGARYRQEKLLDIAKEIERLSNDARQNKAKLEDLRGGTFTITSIGNLGGLFSTPIILHPQVGILGIGKIVKRPVFDEHGQIKPADLLYLSLTFDHRVLDGAVGTAFGNALIKQLQNPAALLIAD